MSFDCLCDKPSPHLAVVSPDHKSWVCSEDSNVTGTLSHKQKLWLPVQADLEKVFSHHKFDSVHPGICFLGDPWKENVTSEGGTISWTEIGIEMFIPPGAVPEGKDTELRVRPCLSGPFHLPKEYQLASPVYLISPAFEFLKEVRLSIAHFAGLDSSSDCDLMTFVKSSSKPTYAPHTKYEFKVMTGGIFKEKEHHGVIHLKHFCLTGAAKKLSASSDTGTQQEAKNDPVNNYSIQLYQGKATSELQVAVFSVSLCQPVYAESLKKLLEETFPGMKFEANVVQPRRILESEVVLVIPEMTPEREIVPSRLPTAILQKEVDLPLLDPDYKSSSTYPPLIKLHISLTKPCAGESYCFLEVRGIDQKLKMMLKMLYSLESKLKQTVTTDDGQDIARASSDMQALPQLKADQESQHFSQQGAPEPKLKDLVRLKIADWYSVGLQLDLEDDALDAIEMSHSEFNIQKRKMFTLWLHSDRNPSYQTLARALFLANENRVASDICTKYGISADSFKRRL